MDEPEEGTVDALAAALREADDAVVLTGAGVSTASGVPTYRGEDGVWNEFDPQAFHRRRLDADPAGFWADRIDLREAVYPDGRPDPNAAHDAISTLEAEGHVDAVLTQNVDGLHQAAGSADVVELHGTHHEVRCDDCDETVPAEPVFERARDGERPPTCDCGGVYRPDVVLFGEELPTERFARAASLTREADWFLAAGSSLRVKPVAKLPRLATESGGVVSVVNLESTAADELADHLLRADVTEALPALVDRL